MTKLQRVSPGHYRHGKFHIIKTPSQAIKDRFVWRVKAHGQRCPTFITLAAARAWVYGGTWVGK
jgi:hypothetical protein